MGRKAVGTFKWYRKYNNRGDAEAQRKVQLRLRVSAVKKQKKPFYNYSALWNLLNFLNLLNPAIVCRNISPIRLKYPQTAAIPS